MEPFRVYILGCGSALPTTQHFPSMQIVECRGKLFMVDCGEGAQLQLRHTKLSFGKLGHIFISHLHGDHCFGLIGLISTFGLLGRTAALHIHAPAGLKGLLDKMIPMFCRDLGYEVIFHEVDTKRHLTVYEDRSLQVETIPLDHRVPTCGYLFREKETLPHIRRDMIDFYQIPVSQINIIKSGMDWTTPDGQTVSWEKLTTPAEPPRAYAYCSDTAFMPTLHELLDGVNTLYHESTYADDNLLMAQKYHHSTARQAATVARNAKVDKLLLGHYSSRYTDEGVLLNEAREVFANTFLTQEMDIFEV